jgi:hypothetical protein
MAERHSAPHTENKYEISNAEYVEFLKATKHAAPAYWDDSRLNKPNQPVVGVHYADAKAFCEWTGEAAAHRSGMGTRRPGQRDCDTRGGMNSTRNWPNTRKIMRSRCRLTRWQKGPAPRASYKY